MTDWTANDLLKWNEAIERLAKKMGLDFYPQEFEFCDYQDMLGYQSYSGMPSRYPHWSFGKSFEMQKTMYNYGMSGLAYEMVINTNPCLAYLMIDNSFSMQVLTMAHVYGHNDFFKNNIHFSKTRAELALEMFKRHADRVRRYVEDPGIGYKKVERILDAAHAISMQCDRNFLFKDGTDQYPLRKGAKNNMDIDDEWRHLSYGEMREEESEKPEPKQDLLLFIINNQPYLKDWERDLLGIVRDEMLYFLPQIETKIMNEGWASFWHYTILSRLGLPSSIHMDFIRSHNQVIRPHKGGLNPYHIGYVIFNKLAGSDGHQIDYEINPEIFNVRKIDRDTSFLRRFLTRELAEELFLFEYKTENRKTIVSETSDKEGWEKIRETLISSVGINSIPVIEVQEITSGNELLLKHKFDNRDLELSYLEKTLEHIFTLWNNPVLLTTVLDGYEETFKCKNGKVTKI
jgi:stage V sporulation protein R